MRDLNIFFNYDVWCIWYIIINFKVDFIFKFFCGKVIFEFEFQMDESSKEIIFDFSYLDVLVIKLFGEFIKWEIKDC